MSVPTVCACGEVDCAEHKVKRTPWHKDKAHAARWRRLSLRLRRRVGACERCGATTDLSVHHVLPVSKYPERAFDERFLKVLCRPCNRELGDEVRPEDVRAALIAAGVRR